MTYFIPLGRKYNVTPIHIIDNLCYNISINSFNCLQPTSSLIKMDNKTAITVALANINSTIEVLRDNTEFNLIHSNLNTVKIVLENQLNDNHSDAYYDYTRNDPNRPNPFTKPEDIARANKVVGKENTYAVQEETTEGWTNYDNNSNGLTKEKAKELIDDLINDGTSPDRLRVIVDGTI